MLRYVFCCFFRFSSNSFSLSFSSSTSCAALQHCFPFHLHCHVYTTRAPSTLNLVHTDNLKRKKHISITSRIVWYTFISSIICFVCSIERMQYDSISILILCLLSIFFEFALILFLREATRYTYTNHQIISASTVEVISCFCIVKIS